MISVPILLRAEALVELTLALAGYHAAGGGWGMFAALFLVPDLGMLGYLANPRLGARIYNLAHCYAAPAVLALAGGTSWALIWAAHIAFDRVLGFGLKYPDGFRETHLRARESAGFIGGGEAPDKEAKNPYQLVPYQNK